MASLRCSIVTPTSAVFDDEITYASIPAWDGQVGVMTGQSPSLMRLGVGSLRLDFPAGGSRWYLIDGGFVQIQGDHVTLLTEGCTPAEELSVVEAEAALAEAAARVTRSGEDRRRVEHDQELAFARKRLAEGASGRGGAI